jgi:hypothetical protein
LGSLTVCHLDPVQRAAANAPPAQALVLPEAVTSVNWLIPPLTPTVFAIRQPVLAA